MLGGTRQLGFAAYHEAVAGDSNDSDPWQFFALRSQTMITHGVIGAVIGAVATVLVLFIAAPAGHGHAILTLVWILAGLVEFLALLSIGMGILGRIMWKRRQAILHSRPPTDIAAKNPANDTDPLTE